MAEAAHEFDPQNAPLNRELLLVSHESEESGPEGPFFVLETGYEPDIKALAGQIEKSGDGRSYLQIVLVSLGYAEPLDQVREYRQILEQIQGRQDEADADEMQIAEDLAAHIHLHETTQDRLRKASDIYRDDFQYGAETGRVNTDALMDLYDDTEDYEDTPLLRTFTKLREISPNNYIVLEAERLARIIIRNEVTPEES